MTPERYVQCLETIRWPNETLAEALGCDESLTEAWAAGLVEVPPKVAAWLDVLALAHQAAESGKPTSFKGKRFTGEGLVRDCREFLPGSRSSSGGVSRTKR